MNDDNELSIALHGEARPTGRKAMRPPDSQVVAACGSAEREPAIYFLLQAWSDSVRHALTSRIREVGGFLVGAAGSDYKGDFLIIRGAIPAVAAEESSLTVKFTHQSWAFLEQERLLRYPNETLVGWYHTHPGYGVVYSNYDVFIQKNFFNGPAAVGVVFDPLYKELGIYQYRDRLIQVPNWRVFRPDNKPVALKEALELAGWMPGGKAVSEDE